jgi:hypothetical protein
MKSNPKKLVCLGLVALAVMLIIGPISPISIVVPEVWAAGDLDDGISEFTDDSIDKYDELGKADKNIKFIKMKAKSQASARANKGQDGAAATSGSQNGNMNSVVLAPGTNVKGDIIIIDESKGPKYNVVE